jgi:gag-polypeptide of LTR copia-type
MAEANIYSKKISLRDFRPDAYKAWEMSSRATLKLNKLFDIVDGSDPDPTPRNDDGTVIRPIPARLQPRIDKWKHDHKRAREAIIRCLPNAEFLKLDNLQEDVTAIWNRLRNEYRRPSNLEYVRASNELSLLKKDEKMSINDHINRFEQLVYDVNYNKPSDTRNMDESVVNLKFLNTLMTNESTKEKWETFINAKGLQLKSMSTQQLHAEVRVNAAKIKSAETFLIYSDEVRALRSTVDFQQIIQDLNSRIDKLQQNSGTNGNGNRNEWRDGRRGGNNSNGSTKLRVQDAADYGCKGCGEKDHDIDHCPLHCVFCKPGHIIDDCLKLRWVNEQRHSKRPRDTGHRWGAERPENGSYQPSSKRPHYG